MNVLSRREFLPALAGTALAQPREARPLRGIFIILATPYTQKKEVDYEDLAREVEFLERCGVQGMVWPQLASEYAQLGVEERMRGMETLAKAARGKRAALVLGVQGPNTGQALPWPSRARPNRCEASSSSWPRPTRKRRKSITRTSPERSNSSSVAAFKAWCGRNWPASTRG